MTGRGGAAARGLDVRGPAPVAALSVPGLSLGGKSGPTVPGSTRGHLPWIAVTESRGTRSPGSAQNSGSPGEQLGGMGRSASTGEGDLVIWVGRPGEALAGSRGIRPVLVASGP